MARALDHHLHVFFPGALGQLAQAHQFFDLAHITGVGQATGAAGVAQRNGHVVFAANVQNFIKALVEGVFLARHAHPGEHQRAPAGNDVHLALVPPDLLDRFAGDAAVQGDEVHAVFGVQAHHVDKVLGGERRQIALVMDHAVVYRHGADHGGALMRELLAEGLRIAMGGKVHDRLGPHVHGGHHLLHFDVIVLAIPRNAEVHIDLGAQHGTHAVGIDAGVQPVGAPGPGPRAGGFLLPCGIPFAPRRAFPG